MFIGVFYGSKIDLSRRSPAWSGANAGARSAGSVRVGGASASSRSSGELNLLGSTPEVWRVYQWWLIMVYNSLWQQIVILISHIYRALWIYGAYITYIDIIYMWRVYQWPWRKGTDWLEVPRQHIFLAHFFGAMSYVRGYPHKIWPEKWYSTSILGSWNSHW